MILEGTWTNIYYLFLLVKYLCGLNNIYTAY